MNTKSSDCKTKPQLAGVAGEYFVAAELSRRGYIASISLRNARGIDILATNEKASRSVTIQCKTTQVSASSWMLNEKCETFASEKHFYVFVGLGSLMERPQYHIVPSAIVAKYIYEGHRNWLKTTGVRGQPRVDTPMRRFTDRENEYLERWDLLGL
jgi:hypothetical protein